MGQTVSADTAAAGAAAQPVAENDLRATFGLPGFKLKSGREVAIPQWGVRRHFDLTKQCLELSAKGFDIQAFAKVFAKFQGDGEETKDQMNVAGDILDISHKAVFAIGDNLDEWAEFVEDGLRDRAGNITISRETLLGDAGDDDDFTHDEFMELLGELADRARGTAKNSLNFMTKGMAGGME